MGVEFGLFNHKTWTMFELDKGPWDAEAWTKVVEHPDRLPEWVWWCTTEWAFDNEAARISYCVALADRLHVFIDNAAPFQLEMLRDSEDRYEELMRHFRYRSAGSRFFQSDYRPATSEEVDLIPVRARRLFEVSP